MAKIYDIKTERAKREPITLFAVDVYAPYIAAQMRALGIHPEQKAVETTHYGLSLVSLINGDQRKRNAIVTGQIDND